MNNKNQVSLKSLTDRAAKLINVLDASFSGRIGKKHHTIVFKGNALNLGEYFSGAGLQVKIKTGFPVAALRFDEFYIRPEIAANQPFIKDLVRRLAVNINEPIPFINSYQVIFCLAPDAADLLNHNIGIRKQ